MSNPLPCPHCGKLPDESPLPTGGPDEEDAPHCATCGVGLADCLCGQRMQKRLAGWDDWCSREDAAPAKRTLWQRIKRLFR